MRHARKLKRGVLSGNSFELIIRDWQGDKEQTIAQLELIKSHGIANYFGSQRFGHEGQNVTKALALFEGKKVGREQRSIYLSAARSYLFNQVLACRVAQQNWNQPLAGDTYVFDQSHSYFKSELPDQDVIDRVAAQAIHPTGPLWGRGEAGVSADAQAVIERYPDLVQGLLKSEVDMDRRSLRVCVQDLQWQFINDAILQLRFTLPAGSYATSVLREIIMLNT